MSSSYSGAIMGPIFLRLCLSRRVCHACPLRRRCEQFARDILITSNRPSATSLCIQLYTQSVSASGTTRVKFARAPHNGSYELLLQLSSQSAKPISTCARLCPQDSAADLGGWLYSCCVELRSLRPIMHAPTRDCWLRNNCIP